MSLLGRLDTFLSCELVVVWLLCRRVQLLDFVEHHTVHCTSTGNVAGMFLTGLCFSFIALLYFEKKYNFFISDLHVLLTPVSAFIFEIMVILYSIIIILAVIN